MPSLKQSVYRATHRQYAFCGIIIEWLFSIVCEWSFSLGPYWLIPLGSKWLFSPDANNTRHFFTFLNMKQVRKCVLPQEYGADPDEYLPEFLAALETAGINDIVADYQAQLDEWLKTYNK